MTIDTQTALESLLKDIAQQLGAIAQALRPADESLGFGPSPGRQYIYVNRSQGCNWYRLDPEGHPIAIEAPALTGYIVGLEIRELQRRGKAVPKLHLHIKADRHYVLESGAQSVFSKSLVAAIARLQPTQLRQPIAIEPQAAEGNEAEFARLYLNGEYVHAPWDDNSDFHHLTQQAIAVVQAAQA
ncbi:hypothetical protein VZH09_09640 [Synechococcus elongatus IITB7]|uniref:hypothetical protein n=1 Tax=Synechococcus elongatus TaxID=32046 RepID=UPI0030D4CD8F